MTKYKAYYKSKNIISSSSASSTTTECKEDNTNTILDDFYHVKDSNGKYDYSKVTTTIVNYPPPDKNLLYLNLLFSYPWGNFTNNNKEISNYIDLKNIQELNINNLIKELKESDNKLYKLKKKNTYSSSNNWYDFFTINDYNINNNYHQDDSIYYKYCELGEIPLSSDITKSVNRSLYRKKKYHYTFYYSPLALILLFGSTKDDLKFLYKKYIKSKWDLEKSNYNTEDNIKYELDIDNIFLKEYIDTYIKKIFENDICDNINKLYNYYSQKNIKLNHNLIEPLYDKYLNNIYDINVDLFYYDKAYEIATKVLEYNDSKNKNSIFYKKILEKLELIPSAANDIDNYIDILTKACYYCFGKIDENKNKILNQIIINYNNECFNKLNSIDKYLKNSKNNLNFDISNLNIDDNEKLFNDIKDYIRKNNETETIENTNIRDSNCNFINKKINKITNNDTKININLLKNSFLSTLVFYINFFIFITITILLIYLSYYLIINNWKSFKNVFDTLIFGLIILISSIIDYFRFFVWKIPMTKRRVLYVNKLSLDLEYEINLLKKKYANINSKFNTDNILQNIILGIAFICIFIIIFRILIYIINDFSNTFNKNNTISNITNDYASCKNIGYDIDIIYKLYTINDNSWCYFSHYYKIYDENIINKKYIKEIRQELLYLQFNKIEKNVFKESDFTYKLETENTLDNNLLKYKIKFNINLNSLSKNRLITFNIDCTNYDNTQFSKYFNKINDDNNKNLLKEIFSKTFKFGIDEEFKIIDYDNFNKYNIIKYDNKKEFAKYLENILYIININYKHYEMFYNLSLDKSSNKNQDIKNLETKIVKINEEITDIQNNDELEALNKDIVDKQDEIEKIKEEIRSKYKSNIYENNKWDVKNDETNDDICKDAFLLDNDITFYYTSEIYNLKLTNVHVKSKESLSDGSSDENNDLDYCYN